MKLLIIGTLLIFVTTSCTNSTCTASPNVEIAKNEQGNAEIKDRSILDELKENARPGGKLSCNF
jgi:hypothetical protein